MIKGDRRGDQRKLSHVMEDICHRCAIDVQPAKPTLDHDLPYAGDTEQQLILRILDEPSHARGHSAIARSKPNQCLSIEKSSHDARLDGRRFFSDFLPSIARSYRSSFVQR